MDALPFFTGKDVVPAIGLIVDILGAHKSSHTAILIVLLETLTVISLIIVQVEQIVGCTTMVFATSIKLVPLYSNDLVLASFRNFHVFKSLDFTLVALLTKMSPLVLDMLELRLSDFLISDSKVLVETLLLYITRIGVRINSFGKWRGEPLPEM